MSWQQAIFWLAALTYIVLFCVAVYVIYNLAVQLLSVLTFLTLLSTGEVPNG